MPNIVAYHRPSTLDDAVDLLKADNHLALAGGTVVVPASRSGSGQSLVDLQALGLEGISASNETVTAGAMTRLDQLVTSGDIPVLVSDAARLELPSALRNQATIGGTIGQGDADSVLLAALLVQDAQLELAGGASQDLSDYLSKGSGALITSVTIRSGGTGSIMRTGRTPGDVPIVAALASKTGDTIRVALTGVAATPVLVDSTDPTGGLEPPDDFRGTAQYRSHLAATLSARAIEEVSA